MKRVLLVIVGCIGILIFCLYYYNYVAVKDFEAIKDINTTRIVQYLCLSYCFYYIGSNENRLIKYILYSISEFWLFVCVAYAANFALDSSVYLNSVILTIILTFLCSLLLFSLWWRR